MSLRTGRPDGFAHDENSCLAPDVEFAIGLRVSVRAQHLLALRDARRNLSAKILNNSLLAILICVI